MSFAEALIAPLATTLMHLHRNSEEIYHVTQGTGNMRLGSVEFGVRRGDTIRIPPGTPHNVTNTGAGALIILCVSHPAYSDEDTALR